VSHLAPPERFICKDFLLIVLAAQFWCMIRNKQSVESCLKVYYENDTQHFENLIGRLTNFADLAATQAQATTDGTGTYWRGKRTGLLQAHNELQDIVDRSATCAEHSRITAIGLPSSGSDAERS